VTICTLLFNANTHASFSAAVPEAMEAVVIPDGIRPIPWATAAVPAIDGAVSSIVMVTSRTPLEAAAIVRVSTANRAFCVVVPAVTYPDPDGQTLPLSIPTVPDVVSVVPVKHRDSVETETAVYGAGVVVEVHVGTPFTVEAVSFIPMGRIRHFTESAGEGAGIPAVFNSWEPMSPFAPAEYEPLHVLFTLAPA
jgi:hypothetical protein